MARRCDLMGTGRQIGNNVSKSNRKTKRTFLPGLITKTFASEELRKDLKLSITKRTYRTIVKHGTIDDFLVNVKSTNLTIEAIVLKKQIIRQKIAKGTFVIKKRAVEATQQA